MIRLQGPSQIITKDQTIKVFVEGKVIYKEGKPLKQDISSFDLTCNVQPLNGRDLLLVPEGDRFKEQYYVFTNEVKQPLVAKQTVEFNCIKFEVQNVEQWGSFQRARIMRIDVGPNKNQEGTNAPQVPGTGDS